VNQEVMKVFTDLVQKIHNLQAPYRLSFAHMYSRHVSLASGCRSGCIHWCRTMCRQLVQTENWNRTKLQWKLIQNTIFNLCCLLEYIIRVRNPVRSDTCKTYTHIDNTGSEYCIPYAKFYSYYYLHCLHYFGIILGIYFTL